MRKLRRFIDKTRNARFMYYPALTHAWFYPERHQSRRLPNSCSLSDDFLTRLSLAYLKTNKGNKSDIWSKLMPHSEQFRAALESGDNAQLRSVLGDAFGEVSPLMGMAHTVHTLRPKGTRDRYYFSLRCRDAILSLAEALAIRPVMSNVQTPLTQYIGEISGDFEKVLQEIEMALGHDLEPPALGGPPVAQIGSKMVNPDAIRHAYVPTRISQLRIGSDAPILEIGGGFGVVAKYAYLRGHRNYTIIDLPFVCALQAAFLAASLGENAVRLYGEDKAAPIVLWPASHRDELDGRFALVLNMDSLPEIEDAPDYIAFIGDRADIFLSVNQESGNNRSGFSQHIVSSLCDRDERFRRCSRHPYWMEQGYVEELYEIRR